MRTGTLVALAVMLTASLLCVIMIAELLIGCGEKTYYEDRTYITNECLFIPYTPSAGRW